MLSGQECTKKSLPWSVRNSGSPRRDRMAIFPHPTASTNGIIGIASRGERWMNGATSSGMYDAARLNPAEQA